MSKAEPLTKLCAGKWGCGEERWIEEFRVLSTGNRASYCHDCEAEYNRFRKGSPSRYDELLSYGVRGPVGDDGERFEDLGFLDQLSPASRCLAVRLINGVPVWAIARDRPAWRALRYEVMEKVAA